MITLLKFNYKLWKHLIAERKRVKAERHLTKMFYKTLDIAIEMCKRQPRKYYILQKDLGSWEILGSQEVKKLKKFKVVKNDETFVDLDEKSFVVKPENVERLIHEQRRRKPLHKFWNRFMESYYVPVTKDELKMIKLSIIDLKQFGSDQELIEQIELFIQKHT